MCFSVSKTNFTHHRYYTTELASKNLLKKIKKKLSVFEIQTLKIRVRKHKQCENPVRAGRGVGNIYTQK